MFWRFGFHTTSAIDGLLDKDNVTLEEIFDEDDLLQEAKSHNSRLIEFLQSPAVLARLLGYVSGSIEVDGDDRLRFKYPYMATEILCAEIWAIVDAAMDPASHAILLAPFWSAVLDKPAGELDAMGPHVGYWGRVVAVFLARKTGDMLEFIKAQPDVLEKLLTHIETPAIVDLVYRIIQAEDTPEGSGTIDWLSSQRLVPRLTDLLAPTRPPELHTTIAELVKGIVTLSAPSPATSGGAGEPASAMSNRLARELVSEEIVLTMIRFMLDDVALGRPDEKALAQAAEEFAKTLEEVKATEGKEEEKEKVEELKEEVKEDLKEEVKELEEAEKKQEEADGEEQPASSEPQEAEAPPPAPAGEPTPQSRPANHLPDLPTPLPNAASATSSLIASISILVELIRKNNADFSEPHLFHTLRNRLIKLQQEKSGGGPLGSSEGTGAEEGDAMEGLEEAMKEMSQRTGIVHLGAMLVALTRRLGDFQSLIKSPRSLRGEISTSLGPLPPLTFERYRICELYAELLHCSNMGVLNRPLGFGPAYDAEGRLTGGLHALEELARVLADSAGDAPEQPEEGRSSMEEIPVDAPPEGEGEGEARPDAPPAESSKPTPELVPGDQLKRAFMDQRILPTMIDLFFDYPWNNFLHNVVYDIVQQTLNGRMDRGLNRELTISLFRDGRLVERILEGQKRNDESAHGTKKIRLGYAGHMTLIAEEVVKVFERHPVDVFEAVREYVPQPAWDEYVRGTLQETKERDAHPLGGGKPAQAPGSTSTLSRGEDSDDDDELGGGVIGSAARPLGMADDDDTDFPRVSFGAPGGAEAEAGNDQFARYLVQQMSSSTDKFGSSDEDESSDDEVAGWLGESGFDPRDGDFDVSDAPGSSTTPRAPTFGFDDAFKPGSDDPFAAGDDDDGWGPFADSAAAPSSSTAFGSDPFGTGNFEPSTSSSATFASSSVSQNLTPADWARDFHESQDRSLTIQIPDFGNEEEDEEDDAAAGWAGASADAETVKAAEGIAALRIEGGPEDWETPTPPSAEAASSTPPPPPTAADATAAFSQEPLGPGVSPEAEVTVDGRLTREVEGETVTVPKDDLVLLGEAAAAEGSAQLTPDDTAKLPPPASN